MTELDAARYIERAGALALVLGVAVAMSAQPTFARAGRCQRAAFPRGGVGLLPPIPAEMRTAPARKPRAMPRPTQYLRREAGPASSRPSSWHFGGGRRRMPASDLNRVCR